MYWSYCRETPTFVDIYLGLNFFWTFLAHVTVKCTTTNSLVREEHIFDQTNITSKNVALRYSIYFLLIITYNFFVTGVFICE